MRLLIIAVLFPFSATASPNPTPLKVGVVLSLSGITAEYGTALQRGISLGLNHYPNAKRSFSFIYEDAEYSTAKAVQAFHKLVDIDRVDLIYVWGVAFCEALAPLAESRKVPLVAQCISPHVAANRSYVLRFMNTTTQYVDTLLREIRYRAWKRIALVLTENPYLEEMYQMLRLRAPKEIQFEVLDSYQATQNDFRTSVTKLRHGEFDAIGVFLAAGQISRFYLQMRENQLSLPSIGTNFFDSYSEIEMANGSMEGAVFANNYVAPIFAADYVLAYNDLSQVQWAALGYEFVKHLAGIEKPTKGDLMTQLVRAPASSGALGRGRLVRSEYGAAIEFPLVLKEVRGAYTYQNETFIGT
ncbi:MAG: ABC transporter substrate-binding protein [Oligoflexia bacterium]|nr:ABC transporter substrate-binding protein [Oligoflexia bacterium]